MRGEYQDLWVCKDVTEGSPPLARGIPNQLKVTDGTTGITPACAGNTNELSQKSPRIEDHPRLRGEYKAWNQKAKDHLGSPPLARGIPPDLDEIIYTHGITPACAGNTCHSTTLQRCEGDHPRLRGEYTKKIPYLQPFPNLHI